MDEQNTSQPASEEATTMSFTDKIVNVFVSPGELFEYVAKSQPSKSNWVIPLILLVLVSAAFVLVVFSQPAIQSQMQEQQERILQQQVAEGKITQDQMNTTLERAPKAGSTIWMVFGAGGAAVVTVAMLFLYALAFWLVGKFAFKSGSSFGKVTEVVGLAMYISVIGSIVTMLLIVSMGSLHASPSLALLVADFDPLNKTHRLLSSINAATFWYLWVVSVGLGKIFSVSLGKALSAVGVLWALWTAALISFNFGM